MSDAADKLIKEQADFFKKGGVSLAEAREMGVGFLYEDVKGAVKEAEERVFTNMRPCCRIIFLPAGGFRA